MAEEDPIRVYLAARNAYEQAGAAAVAQVKRVQGVGGMLGAWERLLFTNVSVEFPREFTRGSIYQIDARQWPSAEEVALALAGYHQAYLDMHTAWEQVPSEWKSGLQAPKVRWDG